MRSAFAALASRPKLERGFIFAFLCLCRPMRLKHWCVRRNFSSSLFRYVRGECADELQLATSLAISMIMIPGR